MECSRMRTDFVLCVRECEPLVQELAALRCRVRGSRHCGAASSPCLWQGSLNLRRLWRLRGRGLKDGTPPLPLRFPTSQTLRLPPAWFDGYGTFIRARCAIRSYYRGARHCFARRCSQGRAAHFRGFAANTRLGLLAVFY